MRARLELNVLMSIEDVTAARQRRRSSRSMTAEQAFEARRAVMAEIEKESIDKTGLRSDVVTLYQGGQYHLYRFKKYTDVRLVFAPEQQIAFFGGDPDNFEYPRYDLDICFFRVYENDKPAQDRALPQVEREGAPRTTSWCSSPATRARPTGSNTMAELEYLRDIGYSRSCCSGSTAWKCCSRPSAARSEENARQAKEMLFGVQNSRKARDGGLAGLLDPGVDERKARGRRTTEKRVPQHREI